MSSSLSLSLIVLSPLILINLHNIISFFQMAMVFSMQGLGNLLASIVMCVLLFSNMSKDLVWRVGLAFGAVPAAAAFYFRYKAHETEDFRAVQSARVSHVVNILAALHVYWRPLLGTALSWLLLDITFYGNGLFSGTITNLMGLGASASDAALNALYISLLALPGYALTAAYMDRIGRKNLQVFGFLALFVLFVVLGFALSPLSSVSALLLILYGATFLFANFGPNSTTYVIPGEFFPPQVRATCHGLSAASGKVGAGIAAYSFPVLKTTYGISALLIICGAVSLAGALCTMLLVPAYSPESLGGEMRKRLDEYRAKLSNMLAARGIGMMEIEVRGKEDSEIEGHEFVGNSGSDVSSENGFHSSVV